MFTAVKMQNGSVAVISFFMANNVTEELVRSTLINGNLVPEEPIYFLNIDPSEQPEHKFRNAWTLKYNTGKIEISPTQAQQIALSHLRSIRDSKIILTNPSDIETMQNLRDITNPLKNMILDESTPASSEDIDFFKSQMEQLN